MVDIIVGLSAGLIAHQTDYIFKRLERGKTPPSWLLLSRYGVGYLAALAVQSVMAAEEGNSRREVALTGLAAGVTVGLGVAAGHLIDHLKE
jgi:hypothetical protein